MVNIFLVLFYSTTIKTILSCEQVADLIVKNVDSDFTPKSQNEFWGRVELNEFVITRYIKGRNTYLPLVHGKIVSSEEGSKLTLSIKLQPAVVIVLITFSVVLFISFLNMGLIVISVLFLVLFLFHCIMYFWGFMSEKNKAEQWIKSLLKNSE